MSDLASEQSLFPEQMRRFAEHRLLEINDGSQSLPDELFSELTGLVQTAIRGKGANNGDPLLCVQARFAYRVNRDEAHARDNNSASAVAAIGYFGGYCLKGVLSRTQVSSTLRNIQLPGILVVGEGPTSDQLFVPAACFEPGSKGNDAGCDVLHYPEPSLIFPQVQ